MEFGGLFEEYGQPFLGRKKERLKAFLAGEQLQYDEGVAYTVNLVDRDGEIAATGSLEGNVLKCIAVSDRFQGEGLASRIVTLLLNRAILTGQKHLFLFTKPKNRMLFSGLGFFSILETADILLMENKRDGIGQYLWGLRRGQGTGTVGAIVANCNPFTLGHRYLIETAAAQCETLHLFLLSEEKSLFPAAVRFRLAERGLAGLENVILHETSDYLLSTATFPTYFMKDKLRAEEANCELDVRIFGAYFAKELGITKRFVGTEPFCPVTAAYNRVMKKLLPQYGVELVEIPRKEENGRAISASQAREAIKKGDWETLRTLVPASTLDYLRSPEGLVL